MNTSFDPETSAVERLLLDRAMQTPPPALRTRVLAAVDNVLQNKVSATTDGNAAQRHSLPYADVLAGTLLMATALSVLLVAMMSTDVASHRIGTSTERPLLSFAQRAEAAGIMLDSDPPATVHLAAGQPHDTTVGRHRDALHSLDTRSFLQGDL